jgi:phenylacetate-CoA ligase
MVDRLNKYPPDYMNSYPSMLAMLAMEQLEGRLRIEPKIVRSGGEAMDSRTRHLIEEAFGLSPYDVYGSTEHMCVARECHLHNGLHVYNDQSLLELVDDQGLPVEPGKPGEMLITNLYNKCQPLIRYRTGDMATYSEEECDCKMPFPLLKAVTGRRAEELWVQNAQGGYEIIHSGLFVDFFVPGLRWVQVHQLERNRLMLKIVATGDRDEAIVGVTKRMKEILSGKGLQDVVEFDVEILDTIPPNPVSNSGKFKIVISHVGRPRLG